MQKSEYAGVSTVVLLLAMGASFILGSDREDNPSAFPYRTCTYSCKNSAYF